MDIDPGSVAGGKYSINCMECVPTQIIHLYRALLAIAQAAGADVCAVPMRPRVPADIGDEIPRMALALIAPSPLRESTLRAPYSQSKTGSSRMRPNQGCRDGQSAATTTLRIDRKLERPRLDGSCSSGIIQYTPSDGGRGEFVGNYRLQRSGVKGYHGGGDNCGGVNAVVYRGV